MELIWKALMYFGWLWFLFFVEMLMGHPNNVGASRPPPLWRYHNCSLEGQRLTLMSTSSAPSLRVSSSAGSCFFQYTPQNEHSPWKGTIFWEESNLPIMMLQGLCNLVGVFVLWWHIFSGNACFEYTVHLFLYSPELWVQWHVRKIHWHKSGFKSNSWNPAARASAKWHVKKMHCYMGLKKALFLGLVKGKWWLITFFQASGFGGVPLWCLWYEVHHLLELVPFPNNSHHQVLSVF